MVSIDNSNICLIANQNLFFIITTSLFILIHQLYITIKLFKSMDLSRMEILVATNNQNQSTIVGITTYFFVCET